MLLLTKCFIDLIKHLQLWLSFLVMLIKLPEALLHIVHVVLKAFILLEVIVGMLGITNGCLFLPRLRFQCKLAMIIELSRFEYNPLLHESLIVSHKPPNIFTLIKK